MVLEVSTFIPVQTHQHLPLFLIPGTSSQEPSIHSSYSRSDSPQPAPSRVRVPSVCCGPSLRVERVSVCGCPQMENNKLPQRVTTWSRTRTIPRENWFVVAVGDCSRNLISTEEKEENRYVTLNQLSQPVSFLEKFGTLTPDGSQ